MKRSKPLRMSGPLKRIEKLNAAGYPIRKHRPKRRDREDPVDALYREWVHTQPCVRWASCFPHGPVQQSHIRHKTGMGQKPPERQSLPMCRSLHEQWEQRKGVFAGMSQLDRWAWAKPILDEHWERFQAWVKARANRVLAGEAA